MIFQLLSKLQGAVSGQPEFINSGTLVSMAHMKLGKEVYESLISAYVEKVKIN